MGDQRIPRGRSPSLRQRSSPQLMTLLVLVEHQTESKLILFECALLVKPQSCRAGESFLQVKHAYEMQQRRERPRHRGILSSSSAVDPGGGEPVGAVAATLVSSDPGRSPPRVTEGVLFRWEIKRLRPAPLPHTHT